MTASEEIDIIFEEVEDLLTEEACSDSESEKREFIEQGLKRASRLLELAPDYHNKYHLHGLLWYHHPDKNQQRSQRTKQFLRRAVDLSPTDSQFSVQYLGYIHFDEDNYAEALKWFEQTDEDYFERDDRRWRWLKARELALVCRGKIGHRIDLEQARSLASEYVRAERENHNPALPTEIAEFARECIDQELKDSSALAAVVVTMLEDLDLKFLVERNRLNQRAEQDAAGQSATAE